MLADGCFTATPPQIQKSKSRSKSGHKEGLNGWLIERKPHSSILHDIILWMMAPTNHYRLSRKKAIVSVENTNNHCLRWALRSAQSPAAVNPQMPTKYPSDDGFDFIRIETPILISQIEKVKLHNLALNVFGWDNRGFGWTAVRGRVGENKLNFQKHHKQLPPILSTLIFRLRH